MNKILNKKFKNEIFKKKILGGILLSSMLLAGFLAIQSADAKNGNGPKLMMKEKLNSLKKEMKIMPAKFENKFLDKSAGERMLKAEVISVTSTTIKVKARDTEITVNTNTNTIFVNRSWEKISLSDIKPGDKLNIIGSNVSTVAANTITAKLVRDLSIPPGMEKNLTGKVTSVTGNTFKLMVDSKEFTVTVDSSDVIVNRVWNSIVMADIKIGDRVMVFGTVNNLSVEAKFVRDISLP